MPMHKGGGVTIMPGDIAVPAVSLLEILISVLSVRQAIPPDSEGAGRKKECIKLRYPQMTAQADSNG